MNVICQSQNWKLKDTSFRDGAAKDSPTGAESEDQGKQSRSSKANRHMLSEQVRV